jgi:hypothetical protein
MVISEKTSTCGMQRKTGTPGVKLGLAPYISREGAPYNATTQEIDITDRFHQEEEEVMDLTGQFNGNDQGIC